jgi:CysZ protein
MLIPFKGLALIAQNQKIRKRAVIPIVLSFLIFLLGIIFLLPPLFKDVPWLAAAAGEILGLHRHGSRIAIGLRWLLVVLSYPVAIFGLFYALFLASRFVATPFYALLGECVLCERKIKVKKAMSPRSWLRLQIKIFVVSLAKTIVFAVIGLMLFLISFLPGLGLVSMAGFLLMAAFDVIDISLEALEMTFRERILFFMQELPSFVGLATILGLVFLVPGLNFLLFPAAVAGGSEVLLRSKIRSRP